MERRRPRFPESGRADTLFTAKEWDALTETLGLSGRERQILEAVFDGLKDAAIGRLLSMPANTVRSHLTRLHRKLGVTNRASLLVQVFRTHLQLARTRGLEPEIHLVRRRRLTHVRA